MDVRKRGEKPPLPRSREGNESPKQPLFRTIGMGRRVSRLPQAGKPIHLNFLEGGVP